MHSRRSALAIIAASTISSYSMSIMPSRASTFDTDLDSILSNEALLEAARSAGSGKQEIINSRGTVRTRTKSDRKISERSIKMIVGFEVTSKAVYEKKYKGAIRPGGASGITCGIGYDVGYVKKTELNEDWKNYISDTDIALLSTSCGITGSAANTILPSLSTISIPWNVADQQFRINVLPIYVAATQVYLKNTDKLSNDSLGALVSLVYNRGPSFQLSGPRYEEMRQIKYLMGNSSFSLIPDQIRQMARLWTESDVIGVAKRRYLEALLFEEGLSS